MSLFTSVFPYVYIGTPEVAGLTPVQAVEIVRGLKCLNLVGGDVVEVSFSSVDPSYQLIAFRYRLIPVMIKMGSRH